jgi:tetratricopeptide (TPR) repeat protein
MVLVILRRLCALLALLFLSISVTACATVSARERERQVPSNVLADFLADKPEPLRPYYSMVMIQGPRNEVLNYMRSGLAAYEAESYSVATDSFDRALQGIEAVYANNADAEKARKLFTRESYKDFKGEPYERAMAYYYRGLLYMREGDYQNARASFKGGVLQDAFAEEEQNRADFALLIFLEGWASHCAGDAGLASDSFAEVVKLKPDFTPPGPDDNTLVLIETGPSPVKYGDGPKHQLLRYRRGDGIEEKQAKLEVRGEARSAYVIEDIFYQASTRGGRPVDFILDGKVQFQEGTKVAGTVLKTVGLATLAAGLAADNKYVVIAGGVVTILGFVADGVAAAVRPEADIRYWDNLPDKVHLAALSLPDAKNEVRAQVFDSSGDPIEGLSKSGDILFAGKCGFAWIRSRSAIPADVRAPGTVTRPR